MKEQRPGTGRPPHRHVLLVLLLLAAGASTVDGVGFAKYKIQTTRRVWDIVEWKFFTTNDCSGSPLPIQWEDPATRSRMQMSGPGGDGYGGYQKWLAFDGTDKRNTMRWSSGVNWLTYEFETPQDVGCMSLEHLYGQYVTVMGWNTQFGVWRHLTASTSGVNVEGVSPALITDLKVGQEYVAECTAEVCSSKWRLRRHVGSNYIWVYDVKWYKDSGCTEEITVPGNPLGSSGSAAKAFDTSTTTYCDLNSDAEGQIWVGYEFAQPVAVQCVKSIIHNHVIPTVSLESYDTITGGWQEWGHWDMKDGKIGEVSTFAVPSEPLWLHEPLTKEAPAKVIRTEQDMKSYIGSRVIAGEYVWNIRHGGYIRYSDVPRRMFTKVCGSLAVVGWSAAEFTSQQAGFLTNGVGVLSVFEVAVDGTATHKVTRPIPECNAMYDVEFRPTPGVGDGCGAIFAMCRGAQDTPLPLDEAAAKQQRDAKGYVDLIDDVTQHGAKFSQPTNDQGEYPVGGHWMYLLEVDQELQAVENKKWVIHKTIGSWEIGNNLMSFSKDGNRLTYVCKAFSGYSGHHEADSMYTIDFTQNIDTARYTPPSAFLPTGRIDYAKYGDSWACGGGHTNTQHLSYNPDLDEWLHVCGTDGRQWNAFTLYARLATKPNPVNLLARFERWETWPEGGEGMVVPNGQAGWILTIVTQRSTIQKGNPWGPEFGDPDLDTAPGHHGKEVMLLWVDPAGLPVKYKFVVSDPVYHVGVPALARIGDNEFVLGWGLMKPRSQDSGNSSSNENVPHGHAHIPLQYFVRHIDADGNTLGGIDRLQVRGAGWGELDTWAVAHGRPFWAFCWAGDSAGAGYDFLHGKKKAQVYWPKPTTKMQLMSYRGGEDLGLRAFDWVQSVRISEQIRSADTSPLAWSTTLAASAEALVASCSTTTAPSKAILLSGCAPTYGPTEEGAKAVVRKWQLGRESFDFTQEKCSSSGTTCDAWRQIVVGAHDNGGAPDAFHVVEVGCAQHTCGDTHRWGCVFSHAPVGAGLPYQLGVSPFAPTPADQSGYQWLLAAGDPGATSTSCAKGGAAGAGDEEQPHNAAAPGGGSSTTPLTVAVVALSVVALALAVVGFSVGVVYGKRTRRGAPGIKQDIGEEEIHQEML